MGLIDKLRDIHRQPADADLLGYLGIRPGDPLIIGKTHLTVGAETIPLRDARLAVAAGAIPVTPEPRRSVRIGDL